VDGLTSVGYLGGPFIPSSRSYTLSNSGETALDWTAANTAAWLDLSAAGGTLAPGAETTVTASITPTAVDLAAGTYVGTLSFEQVPTQPEVTRLPVTLDVALEVASPPRFVLHTFADYGTLNLVVEAIAGTEIVLESTADLKRLEPYCYQPGRFRWARHLYRSHECQPAGPMVPGPVRSPGRPVSEIPRISHASLRARSSPRKRYGPGVRPWTGVFQPRESCMSCVSDRNSGLAHSVPRCIFGAHARWFAAPHQHAALLFQ
jgi:hypothetical protein